MPVQESRRLTDLVGEPIRIHVTDDDDAIISHLVAPLVEERADLGRTLWHVGAGRLEVSVIRLGLRGEAGFGGAHAQTAGQTLRPVPAAVGNT